MEHVIGLLDDFGTGGEVKDNLTASVRVASFLHYQRARVRPTLLSLHTQPR